MKAGDVPSEILARGFYMRNCASSISDYTYRGESGWRDWIEDLFEEFTGKPRYELEQIVATGEDYVDRRILHPRPERAFGQAAGVQVDRGHLVRHTAP